MPQVMLYLDQDTERLMRESAQAAGVPYSRWVASLIRGAAGISWPATLVAAFGAFPEMPLASELRTADVPDSPRERW